MNLLQRATAYRQGIRILSDWVGDGGVVVSKEQAQLRADTCLGCNENKAGWVAVEAVASAIREQVELKNDLDLRVEGEKSLHTCAVCVCPIKLKVWTPIEYCVKYMAKQEKEQFPSHCWIVKES
jgi:hypothetical protein